MAKKTQGMRLYAIDPDTESVLTICVTSIDGIDTTNEQIETTTLCDDARTYVSGLATPGQVSYGIQTDPSDSTHVRLHALKVRGDTLNWALGWSDGTAAPTVDSGGTFDLPTTRSWIRFQGFMTNFPFAAELNGVVRSTVSVQVSGEPELIAKV